MRKTTNLIEAVLSGANSNVKSRLKAGDDVNEGDVHLWTPLHFAAQDQDEEIATTLLNAGADANAKDENGNTPLFRAVFNYRGKGQVISLLLKYGADPTISNNHGVSPLKLANTIANYNSKTFFENSE